MDKPRIKIIVPSYLPLNEGGILKETFANLQLLEKEFDTKVINAVGTYIGQNRNYGITGGCKKPEQHFYNVDYFLFIDTDCYSDDPVKSVYSMIDTGHDIISGCYKEKTSDNIVAGYVNFEENRLEPILDNFGIHQVDYVGAGWLLVSTNVINKMQFPYFRCHSYYTDKNCYAEFQEDVGFCLYANNVGYRTYIDINNKIHHEQLTKGNAMSTENATPKNTVSEMTNEEIKIAIFDASEIIDINNNNIKVLRAELNKRKAAN